MKNTLIKFTTNCFVFVALYFIALTSVSAFNISWTSNPNNCKPVSSSDLYNGQSCYPNGQAFCGLSGSNVQCADLDDITTAPAVNANSSTIYSGSNPAGYIINCLTTSDASSPYCNNNGAYWCNSDATCLNTNHRVTRCNASLWSYQGASSFTCTNSCVSGYYDCNGGVNCELQNGSACAYLPGIDGTYVCTADAGGSCRNEVLGGGATYSCICTPGKSFFETGTNSMYSTTDPLLWGTQYGSGDLINFGNSTTAEVFNVDNSGLLTTTNNTVNTMRIAFNDGVGIVGIYSINTNPDGTLVGKKGSLAMDYANGKLYVNIDGSTEWNQLLDDSSSGGPMYTISTGLTDTSGTLTADISTGKAGGQTIYGGTAAGDSLTIDSTTNGTKGNILLNPNGGNVGIGTNIPFEALEVNGNIKISKREITEGWLPTSTADAPFYTANHTSIWTGGEMIIWGGIYRESPFDIDRISNFGARYNPSMDKWFLTNTSTAPRARYGHTSIWTGSKMMIWGGFNGTDAFNDGAIYDPKTDTWQAIPEFPILSPRYYHTAVWTGNKMVVWGGKNHLGAFFNDGGIFDPETNTWSYIATSVRLTGRIKHTMIWSGKDVYIWGGETASGDVNDGIKYNIENGYETDISSLGAPTARSEHKAIWTGSKMFIIGGTSDLPGVPTGGLYDPVSDSWKLINAYSYIDANHSFSLIWTGDKAIIWGGKPNVSVFEAGTNTGAIYDPSKDAWEIMTVSANTPAARYLHTAVWTGSKMIIFGGLNANSTGFFYLNSGGIYTPSGYQGNLIVEGNAFINGKLSTVEDITAGGYYSLGGADLAENYIASDPSITAGDVVKITSGLKLSKTIEGYDSDAVGVVSSKPGMTLSDLNQITEEDKSNLRPLALSGRVPVKVTTENGNIEVGDYLVPASKTGYAMKQCGVKSCNSGVVIGRALEQFNYTDSGDTNSVIDNLEKNIAEVENTKELLENSEAIDNDVKSEVLEIADVAKSLSRSMDTNSYGEGRILMFVDLSYRLTTQQEDYLKSISLNPKILSNTLGMNQIDSQSLSVVDMNVSGLLTTDKISTNQILAFNNESISVNLGDSEGNTEFRINNALGEKIFSVSSLGKLFVSDAKDKGSVGSGIIKSGELSVKIDSKSMNKSSKVFLTLTTKVENPPSLVVSNKQDGSFEVSISDIKAEDIGFDWWIIN